MSSHPCRRLWMSLSLVVVLLMSWSAFAGELSKPGERIYPEPKKHRDVAPLLYVLPELGNTQPVLMQIHIYQAKHLLVTEIVKLPAFAPAGATVDVLFTHPKELTNLRTIEKETPGSLRFVALVGEKVVTDEPFANIEAGGAGLRMESAVGEIQEVSVTPAPKLRVRALDDCSDACDAAYWDCYARCDERGDSCAICSNQWQDCLRYCPQPCTEPKSQSDYTTCQIVAIYYFGEAACFSYSYPYGSGYRYEHYYVVLLCTNYHRVEHCDGSYTDTQTGQYYASYWCWYNTYIPCGPPTDYPFPEC